jgi:hypothetical protein
MTGTEWIAFVGGPAMILLFLGYVRFVHQRTHAAVTKNPAPEGG